MAYLCDERSHDICYGTAMIDQCKAASAALTRISYRHRYGKIFDLGGIKVNMRG